MTIFVTDDPMRPGSGCLKNGNPGGNPNNAPRCDASTSAGARCKGPAMTNGKCRMHGGASTGPKTAAGRAAQRAAVTDHGFRGELGRVLADVRRLLLSRGRLLAVAGGESAFTDASPPALGSKPAWPRPRAIPRTHR
jgi:hypothetical protein